MRRASSISKKTPQAVLGLLEIGIALVSNFYQLTRLATIPTRAEMYDRLTFLAAGIAVIAHGVKEIEKGLMAYAEKRRGVKHQSNESSPA